MHRLLAGILLCLASLSFAQDIDLNDLSAGNALGGPEILDTIKNAQTVTAQRVDSKIAETREQAEAHPKLILLGEPFEVSQPEAGQLKQAFTQGSTYLSPSKSCEFRANVRYGFIAPPDRKVELVLCFGCGELEVWSKDRLVSFGPFDGGYGRILEITKRLFPKDEFLAKFSEEVFRERAARIQVEKPQ